MGGKRVLVVGNTVLDVIGKTPERLPRFGELAAGRGPADIDIGGNGAIAAAAASVLGARAALASAVGKDTWGRWLRQRLEALGVDTRQLVEVPDAPTATTVSLVRPDGERALLTHNGASDLHGPSTVDPSGLEEGDWVLVASLLLVPAYSGPDLRGLLEAARSRGAKVALDLSWDCSGNWDVDGLSVDLADVVMANDMELRAAGCTTDLDVAIERMLAKGARTLVVKLGAAGARIVTKDGTDVTVPAFDLPPVNATGTGDVFNAALLKALSEGQDMEGAVRFACAAGALRVAGGCHTFPTEEEVRALLLQAG